VKRTRLLAAPRYNEVSLAASFSVALWAGILLTVKVGQCRTQHAVSTELWTWFTIASKSHLSPSSLSSSPTVSVLYEYLSGNVDLRQHTLSVHKGSKPWGSNPVDIVRVCHSALSQYTDYTSGWTTGVNSGWKKLRNFSSSPPRPDRLWGPPILLSNGNRG
jgi:hypothetical protein